MPFSDEEDWLIFLFTKVNGRSWIEISEILPGRSDNVIKNYYNSMFKKKKAELE
jgi:Myb-like DNA-binding domain